MRYVSEVTKPILTCLMLWGVLGFSGCAVKFNNPVKPNAATTTVETSSPENTYVLTSVDPNVESGSSDLNQTANFGMNRVSGGGTYHKTVATSASFRLTGGAYGN